MTSTRTIAAIPTTYNGIEFRSRLEARWAIFFEGLRLRWEYEPEGFFLGEAGEYDPALMYLPDFLVLTPQGKEMWFEIKPITIKQDDKFDKFYQLLHKPKNKEEEEDPSLIKSVRAELLSGQPKDVLKEYNICPRCGFFLEIGDTDSDRVYCWHCDFETPCGGGHELEKDSVLNTPCRPHKGDICPEGFNNYTVFPSFYSRTREIAEYCRSARFEHGESGSTRKPISYWDKKKAEFAASGDLPVNIQRSFIAMASLATKEEAAAIGGVSVRELNDYLRWHPDSKGYLITAYESRLWEKNEDGKF